MATALSGTPPRPPATGIRTEQLPLRLNIAPLPHQGPLSELTDENLDRGEEPEEGREFVVSDEDDTDEPAAQVTQVGATADPVKDYLKQIGKVALLNAEQEVELAKRIEAGLFAEEKLNSGEKLAPQLRRELEIIAGDGRRARNHLLEANLRLVVSVAKRYTGRGHAVPGPDPGGQPRPDPRGGEVRLHQGLQVLHLRHLVDPAGDAPAPWPTRPAPSGSRCTWSK